MFARIQAGTVETWMSLAYLTSSVLQWKSDVCGQPVEILRFYNTLQQKVELGT